MINYERMYYKQWHNWEKVIVSWQLNSLEVTVNTSLNFDSNGPKPLPDLTQAQARHWSLEKAEFMI